MSLGPWQLFLVLIIILVLFGAGRLPQVMGDLGKGIKTLNRSLRTQKNYRLMNQIVSVLILRDMHLSACHLFKNLVRLKNERDEVLV